MCKDEELSQDAQRKGAKIYRQSSKEKYSVPRESISRNDKELNQQS